MELGDNIHLLSYQEKHNVIAAAIRDLASMGYHVIAISCEDGKLKIICHPENPRKTG